MPSRTKVWLSFLILAPMMEGPAGAYDQPLSSTMIREAYFLGSGNDEKTSDFLVKYAQRLPTPKKGAHIAEIEIQTPYAQVVERARKALPGYSAQQAEQEFANKPGLFYVRVWILLTPSYSNLLPSQPGGIHPRPVDFWRQFAVRLFQEREIPPQSIRGWPLYTSGTDPGSSLAGAEVELEYDTSEIESVPVQIEVRAPDGQRIEATFDLAKLR